MIIRTKHTCAICGKEYWSPDDINSKNPKDSFLFYCLCENCDKTFKAICSECASKGCSCGGKIVSSENTNEIVEVINLPPMMI